MTMNNFFSNDIIIEKIILACVVKSGQGNDFHKDRPSHGLAFITDGEKLYEFSDGKTITARKNDIIYLPKNSTYKVTNITNGDTYAINFLCSTLENEPFIMNIKNPNTIIYAYKKAEDFWTGKREGYLYRTIAQLYNILYETKKINALKYIPSSKVKLIEPAIEFIHNNYSSTQIDIEGMAKLCNMSCVYFRRIFANAFGSSPIKYINNLKIERAKELLRSRLYSVTEVCEIAGFSDPAYFCRLFKKEVGVTPSEFYD
jgi:AraC-like DNA-binding protein